MALIITLILLAVVTFMALTFLAISRRERGAVTTSTDTASAKLAADDALAAAEGQIVANTLATTNPYNFGLLVSTNYINPSGFWPGVVGYTNVNYNFYSTRPGPLTLNDFLLNLGNLYYLPRPPVFIPTNATGPLDFRFYLDLNRNGRFDTNGVVGDFDNNNNFITNVTETGDPEWIGVLQHPDQPYGPNNPFVARYAFIAVPIGNALDLNAIHNQVLDESQQGVGNNKTVSVNPPPGGVGDDTFLRNQGVGSWEINLAAFLADLNTNQWDPPTTENPANNPYKYQEWNNRNNQGVAFDDARALLAYRYGNNYLSLNPASRLFPNLGVSFRFDNIDGYSDGPLQTTPAPINEAGILANRDNPTLRWAGADNTNQFFSVDDLFDSSKELNQEGISGAQITAGNDLATRLQATGANFSTYDRYTYYRLLSQMGVGSQPEQGKLNLNYVNVDNNGNVVPDMETNLIPWTPLQFFTNAADRMLRDYSQEWLEESPSNYLATYGSFINIGTFANPTNMPIPIGISHIPVFVNNQFVYTPAVQRVLQLAANIYDAMTNKATQTTLDYPSVFRPIFEHDNFGNLFIVGYTNLYSTVGGDNTVSGPSDPQLALPYDIASISNLIYSRNIPPFTNITDVNGDVNVYGVPWIIGAKKGFPNFNQFAMESAFQLTRKVQVARPNTNSPTTDYSYNQMFNLSISNQLGVECWNSYAKNFLDPVSIYVTDTSSGLLTNNDNFGTSIGAFITGYLPINITSNNNNGWPGYNPLSFGAPLFLTPASFQIPLYTNVTIITNSTYRFNGGAPFLTTNVSLPYEVNVVDPVTGSKYPQPHWFLASTNDIRVIMLDGPQPIVPAPYHILDYVQLSGPTGVRDVTSEIINNYDMPAASTAAGQNQLWSTNLQAGVPIGILSQVQVARGQYSSPNSPNIPWDPKNDQNVQNGIDAMRAFYHQSPIYNNPSGRAAIAAAYMTNAFASPYQPTATVVQHINWQVNDPLVHYLTNDLRPGAVQPPTVVDGLTNEIETGVPNLWYMPWGISGGGTPPSNVDPNVYNLAVRDPLVWRSDDWDFPTYKFPTVGWLGRVHRGTPWQTVYLKAPDILREIQAQTIGSSATTTDIGTNTWVWWTGNILTPNPGSPNPSYFDAANAAPAQDRLLFDIFTTALNDNATRGQLSVNVGASDSGNPQAALAAWSALLSGVEVLSNSAPVLVVQHNGSVPVTAYPINPAGPLGINSAVGQIVAAINQTRDNANNTAWVSSMQILNGGTVTIADEVPATFINPDGLTKAFEHVGDILSVPQFSAQSPFLNTTNVAQLEGGISDEMYEWLPEQVMSLLRVSDSPRYVIYSYGQTLKPAPNGIYTSSGPFFGMVTNYQVVAEAATRAVVRFDGVKTNIVTSTGADAFGNPIWSSLPVVTNNNAVIEQFNVLPAN